MTLAAVLHLVGCPQLAEDSFEKVDDVPAPSGVGGHTATGTVTSAATGFSPGSVGGVSVSGGATGGSGTGGSGNGGSGNDGDTNTNSAGAGAPGTGGESATTETTTTSTTGGGGTQEVPTTLVYAASDSTIYAAAWDGTELGTPTEWDSFEDPIAFVEARLAPDHSWAVAGVQTEASDTCRLLVYRYFGAVPAAPLAVDIGEPENCTTARAFDIAFEQQSGRALLVYALPAGELGYQIIERELVSEPKVLVPTELNVAINWVRAVPDSASNDVAVGFSAAATTRNPLFVQEWNGSKFGATRELVKNGVILGTESFDFAYYGGELIALRGDDTDDGFGYHLRGSDGRWQAEEFRSEALNGNAQVIELRTMPYGIAGALFDAAGTLASFGTVLWQDGDFAEETRLDNSLPDVLSFELASLKTDIQRLGDAAVTVYANAYEGESDAVSSLGWAILRPDDAWTVQQDTLPIPFDQETREALTRSIRLARFTADLEGLLLAFADEGGLWVSSLTELEVGFSPPVLVEADVDGLSTTPFALIGP